ncbi:YqgE/AlgH family protein [Streptomyces sp. NPDC046887]|uniref:YqgE/AlgH family protein n=1 Tax=Streptomyces sp. NPDC046887 TaxID=3155472 RepID=UPI0033C9463C
MTEVSSLTGRLLVATPALADPNFDRAVVLLLDHDDEGTLGVVLNRPTPVGVGDILEPWAPLAGEPGVVFQGGPVSLDAALGLAVVPGDGPGGLDGPPGAPGPDGTGGAYRADGSPDGGPDGSRSRTAGAGESEEPDEPDESEEPEGLLGWRRVYGAIGLVDLEAPPELLAAELGSLRIFAGYAGWGPGQLEDELAEGAWFVVDSEPGDVSSPRPETLWRDVLRRQRSELAMIATYPDDPSLN